MRRDEQGRWLRGDGTLVPIDDIGAFGGMAVVLSSGHVGRPECPSHPGQRLAWVRGWWECPRDDCDHREEG